MIGGKVAVRDAKTPLQFDGIARGSGTMVCSQITVASETWAAEISPGEPRISVVPFSTSRPRMRAVALALILQRSVAPKR